MYIVLISDVEAKAEALEAAILYGSRSGSKYEMNGSGGGSGSGSVSGSGGGKKEIGSGSDENLPLPLLLLDSSFFRILIRN